MKPLTERRRRSARETFANCRARYKAEYCDGVDMSSAATRRGNCFASAKARYLSALFSAQVTDDAEMAQEAITWARVNTPGLTHEEWIDCENLWARFAPDYRLSLQHFYSVEGEQPCFDTVLRFDEVEVTNADTLTIIDDKTFWRIPPTSALEQSYQVAFYLAGARKVFPGFQFYRFVFRFVRYGVLSDPIVLDASQLDLIEQSIRESDEAMAQAEDTNVFPATGGKHCSTCTLALECFQSQIKTIRGDLSGRLMQPDPYMLAVIASVIDKARADVLANLKDAVDRDGPVVAGGVEFAHRPKVTTQYPAEAVIDLCTVYQVPMTKLSLSASAIKPLMVKKNGAPFRQCLDDLAVTKSTGTVFSGKPIVSDEDAEPEAE